MTLVESAAFCSKIYLTDTFVTVSIPSERGSFIFRRQDYPDYFSIIAKPIAMSNIRKRVTSNNYKDVNAFRDDFRLMFNNARTYNQEGSWVYVDAEEMEKVFNAAWERHVVGSGVPGAAESVQQAPTPVGLGIVDDERPVPPRSRGSARKLVVSDDEYLTQSEED